MQEQKRQPMSGKDLLFSSIVAGCVFGAVAGLVQNLLTENYPVDSTPEFFSVKCQQIWVVDEEGNEGILLSVNDKGGSLIINGIGDNTPDYRKSVSLSIDGAGGMLHVSGTESAILATSNDGVHIYDDDGNVTGALPDHPHPHALDKEESQ